MLDTHACGLRQTLPMTRFINIGLCQKRKNDPNYQSGLNLTAHTMYFSKYMQNIHHNRAGWDRLQEDEHYQIHARKTNSFQWGRDGSWGAGVGHLNNDISKAHVLCFLFLDCSPHLSQSFTKFIFSLPPLHALFLLLPSSMLQVH